MPAKDDIIKQTRWVLENTRDQDIDYSDFPELVENDPGLIPVPEPLVFKRVEKASRTETRGHA